jgi:thymidine kinase
MYLELIVGCMFSGKSSELIRRLKRHLAIGERVLVVNSARDARHRGEVLQTHDGVTFDCVKTDDLVDVCASAAFAESDVVGIDEAQFFSHLRDFVECCLLHGKKVIVAGLDGDFRQRVFGEVLLLTPLADRIDKLTALCMKCRDGTPGPFSRRVVECDRQELVGASDAYMAVCRNHLKR